MRIGTTAVLVAMLLLPTLIPVALAEGPAWDMEVYNRRPFLGDKVLIRVSSLYANEDAHIEVKFNGTTIKNIWVHTLLNKTVLVEWQTTLESQPGKYQLCLIYLGIYEVNRTVTLVYDPIDFAMKSISRLEREVVRLDEADERTGDWALLALKRIDYYLYRWVLAGLIVNILAIATLVYLGPFAFRKFVINAARNGRRRARDWEPAVDGHMVGQMGKETMLRSRIKEVPEPGVSKWCTKCRVLVHRAEWTQHEHEENFTTPEGFEWEEVPTPTSVKRKVVRPVRVVKQRVVVPKQRRENPLAQEVDG